MTFYDGLLFFSLFTAILPLAWLSIIPFKEKHERFTRKRTTNVILLCIATAAVGYVLHYWFHFERNANSALFAAIPFVFLYYRRIIKEDWQKLLFVFCLAVHASAALTAVRVPVNLLADAITSDKGQADMLIEVFMIIARIVYYPLIIWLTQRYITPCLKRIEPENMKRLWVVPAASTVIAIFSYTYYAPHNSVAQLFAIYVPLNILSFVMYTIILSMLDNVTKNVRLKEESLALERLNRMKSELMTTISHEARTPLAVLSSYTSLVSMELKDKGVELQTASNLDKVAFEAKRVAELIDRLSNSQFIIHNSQWSADKRIWLDIGDVIRQTAGLYRHLLESNSVELRLYIENGLPPVFGIPEELTQVMFNLLQNAQEATAKGVISISAEPEAGCIAVAVSDTGSGIPPGILPRVFERGVSGSGSTGLGLPICKEIIEAHGGEISIDTEENMGTRITVTLPIYERREPDGP